MCIYFFFFSSRRRHTRCGRDWSSDVCSSDLAEPIELLLGHVNLLDLVLHDELIGHIAGAAVDHGLLDDLFGLGLTLLARGLFLTLQIQLTVALGLLRTGTLDGRSGILHLLRGILGGLLLGALGLLDFLLIDQASLQQLGLQ